jgi:hypothetical protein
MKNRLLPKLLPLMVLAGITACAPDEICFTDNSTQVRIDFKRVIYAGTDSAFTENDTLVFAQVRALDTDSIFVDADTLSSVILPLNTGKNETTFVFDIGLEMHTLELRYQRTQRLISVDCGPEQIIDQLESVQSTFDSLAVLQPVLTEPPATNVEIYR